MNGTVDHLLAITMLPTMLPTTMVNMHNHGHCDTNQEVTEIATNLKLRELDHIETGHK